MRNSKTIAAEENQRKEQVDAPCSIEWNITQWTVHCWLLLETSNPNQICGK